MRVALLLGLLAAPTWATEDPFVEAWLELWTRCRVAVETAQRFDSLGLETVSERFGDYATAAALTVDVGGHAVVINPARREADLLFQYRDFYVGIWDRGSDRSPSIHCNIGTGGALGERQEAAISRAFLIERARLIVEGTHEVRNPDQLRQVVGLGVGAVRRNPNGCRTIATMSYEPGEWFASLIGEQGHMCEPRRAHEIGK